MHAGVRSGSLRGAAAAQTCALGCCASCARPLSSSSSKGRGRGLGAGGHSKSQERHGRFILPSSLREADDGRYDDPDEPGAAMPSRSKARDRITNMPQEPPDTAGFRETGISGSRMPSRGRGLPLPDDVRRALLPAELDSTGGSGGRGTDARKRSAGRGTSLPGSFARSSLQSMDAWGALEESEPYLSSRSGAHTKSRGDMNGTQGPSGRQARRAQSRRSITEDRSDEEEGRTRWRKSKDFQKSDEADLHSDESELDSSWDDTHHVPDSHDHGQPYGGMGPHELYSTVIEAQAIFPVKVPKPKGLAKLLYPEEAASPPRCAMHP